MYFMNPYSINSYFREILFLPTLFKHFYYFCRNSRNGNIFSILLAITFYLRIKIKRYRGLYLEIYL